jgi:hypothetical protein
VVVLDIFGFLLGLTIVIFVVRPVAQAFSEKLKARAHGAESSRELGLQERVQFLESEVMELKRQLGQVQETTEYMTKCIETSERASAPETKRDA